MLGLSFWMWSSSNVNSLTLVLAWSTTSHDIPALVPSFPHCLRCCPTDESSLRCSSFLVVRCQTAWPTKVELHPAREILWTFFDFRSNEKYFKDGRQVFSFLVLKKIKISLTLFRPYLQISNFPCLGTAPPSWVVCMYCQNAVYVDPCQGSCWGTKEQSYLRNWGSRV